MKISGFIFLFLLLWVYTESDGSDRLFEGFKNPPVAARPRALWTWVNGNYSLSRITSELEDAKAKGMGGFDIWDVGIMVDENQVVPDGVAFMSDESVQAIAYAIREATRLELEMGLIISSSWNAGGSWIKPEHGVMALYRSVERVDGPMTFERQLAFPELDPITEGRRSSLLEFDLQTGKPSFFQEEGVLAIQAGDDSVISGLEYIINLSDHLKPDGRLTWNVPEGQWRIVRYLSTGTGQPLAVPGKKSNGLMLDHFNPDAMAFHLDYIIKRLQAELGDLSKTSLKYLYTDSYEANSAAWTPAMKKEFKQRNGYDLTPFLPVLEGYTVINQDITERFLFDFKKTLSDMIIENHYATGVEICNAHGLEFNAEAGGPGPPVHNCPFEDIKALGALDIVRGEFWYDHPKGAEHMEELQIIKGPASAAHLYNKKFVEAEAFTSVWLWQHGPGDIKAVADRALCEGLNRFVYHTFPHIPPEAGYPGWVYNFGTIINTTRCWWPLSDAFHTYLARCSFMLQQGDFVADVLFYYGDQAPNFVRPKHIDPSLGFGYDYDIVNSDIILHSLDVKDGRLVLPHGQSYSILVLPDDKRSNPQVLEKIRQLVKKGATVVGKKPEKSYHFYQHEKMDMRVRQIGDTLWGACDGIHLTKNRHGKGQVFDAVSLRTVLSELYILPDLFSEDDHIADKIDFIHRQSEMSDIYFLRNKTNTELKLKIRFRARDKIPAIWHPDRGERQLSGIYEETAAGISLELAFAPLEAYFVLFQDASESKPQPAFVMVAENGVYSFKPAHGGEINISVADLPTPITLKGSWQVRFPHGWGAPAITEFPMLSSWTESENEAIKHFSGIASYHKTFVLNDAWIGTDKIIQLDLGRVEEIADVFLNGNHLKTSWYSPHVIDITSAAKPGANHLVIEVANVWNNQLVLDARRSVEHRRLKSNITRLPNAWMYPFAEAQLLESGLMGPVVLSCRKKIHVPD